MVKKFYIALVMALIVGMPALAQGDCKSKLVEVDVRLTSSDLGPSGAGLKQMRDQAASLCEQGQEATAMQLLVLLDMSLPPTESESIAAQKADESSKVMLTNEFLAGTWCSMTGEERSQLEFNVNGTYRFCLHDAVRGPYGSCSQRPESTADWLARYPRAESVEQDVIVLGGKGGRHYATFNRGQCEQFGR